ncbi:MAG: hypothetical protein R3D89_09175 [Sphingomonadaceae bacterium]
MTFTKALHSAILALAVALVPSGASAQVDPNIETGSKIPRRMEKVDPVRAGSLRDLYVSCTYGPSRKDIDRLLALSDPLTADFEGAGIRMNRMFDNNSLRACFEVNPDSLRSQISMSDTAFRYMMLEAAYLYLFGELPADDGTSAPVERSYVSTGEKLVAAKALGTFSDCIAKNDPAGADALLRTPSGTSEEREAAKALVGTLGACLAAGQQLELSITNIRSFAADGMWQRYVARPE